MSLAELLLVLLVCVIVLGPSKLPRLSKDLVRLGRGIAKLRGQWLAFWDAQWKAQLLEENKEKALKADKEYSEGSQ